MAESEFESKFDTKKKRKMQVTGLLDYFNQKEKELAYHFFSIQLHFKNRLAIQQLPLLQKVYLTQVAFVWLGVFFCYCVVVVGTLAISLGKLVSAQRRRMVRSGCRACQS